METKFEAGQMIRVIAGDFKGCVGIFLKGLGNGIVQVALRDRSLQSRHLFTLRINEIAPWEATK